VAASNSKRPHVELIMFLLVYDSQHRYMDVVLHTYPVGRDLHIQPNTNRAVATRAKSMG